MWAFLAVGPINLDISSLLSFVLGLIAGFLFLLLLYVYAVIKSLNKGLLLRKADEEDIDEEEIKWLIEDAQEQFKDKSKRNEVGYYKYLLEICRDLSIDISKKFYPRSKYPHLELTIDETLHLNHYITNRLDEVLSSKLLRLTRGLTLIKIIEANEVKENIENTKVYQAAKKYKVNQILKTTVGVLNAVNPVYWTRRLIISQMSDRIMISIGKALIAITGEETYKIYSKKVFNQDKTIDTGVEDIYEEILSQKEAEVIVHEEKQRTPNNK